MPISTSLIRYSSSSVAAGAPNFPLKKFSSIAAQDFLAHLQKNQSHIEKTLNAVKSKLDSRCVAQVLEKCGAEKPKSGVRFFVWAALHPTHRHTSYTYTKACKLLNLDKNPRIISDVVDEYKAERFAVSVKMFKVLLNLCRAAEDAEVGLWVLGKMKEFRCTPDTVSYNAVIRLLVAKNRVDEAMSLLQEMICIDLSPVMVTYVSLIKGLCDNGKLEAALGLIKVMKGHGCVPNSVIYSTVLDGICMRGSLEMGMEFLSGMEEENGECKPNVVTYTTMMKGFVEKGMNEKALRVLERMYGLGVEPNRVTFATVLDGLSKEGRVEEACEVIDKYRGGGVGRGDLYNMLVLSLSRVGRHEESEEVLRTMLARGLKPSGLASSVVVRRVVSEGRVLDGFRLFQEVEKLGNLLSVGPDVYSSLFLSLCRENRLEEAGWLVSVMAERRIHLEACHCEDMIKLWSSSSS